MSGLSPLTAAILVGGLGTRLRHVVADRQKVLAVVSGRPFLMFLLDQLSAYGLRDVVLCTGYRADQVREVIGESHGGLRIEYSPEAEHLGTAGALRLALPRFRSEPVLVMNGDSYCQCDLEKYFSWYREEKAFASLVLAEVSDTRRFGRVRLSEDGKVLGFEEKGATTGCGWINAGIYFLSRKFISEIAEARSVSLERDMFPAWIGRGLRGYKSAGRFIDIGTEESYSAAADFFREAGLVSSGDYVQGAERIDPGKGIRR